jgi:hypothetical protein
MVRKSLPLLSSETKMRTEDGRHFMYVCPLCGGPVEGCPDPSCSEEGVGHHEFSEFGPHPEFPDRYHIGTAVAFGDLEVVKACEEVNGDEVKLADCQRRYIE